MKLYNALRDYEIREWWSRVVSVAPQWSSMLWDGCIGAYIQLVCFLIEIILMAHNKHFILIILLLCRVLSLFTIPTFLRHIWTILTLKLIGKTMWWQILISQEVLKLSHVLPSMYVLVKLMNNIWLKIKSHIEVIRDL